MVHPDEMEIVQRFASEHPVDVIALIRALDIEYEEAQMSDGDSGRITVNGDAYHIVVNELEGPQRRRFTAAHELGHYLMHRDLINEHGHLDRLFGPEGRHNPSAPLTNAHEVQANRFAANLLMPSREITKLYDKVNDNYRELAAIFDVSPAAMKIKLYTLGLRASD
ncbi:ImmA/IrrE family metallo-endopeptidase [Thalassobaculum salexigens]|uniref:ImmA/IrrE family metallo-endopeptidase n=1 Tax=Thalassobaculum salexigens TaxID=455360 RepID=UPI000A05FD8A|nr:ImmA/IrrE family metallo-endopeptidase [Thalassobaculum salexigens]